MTYKQIMRLTPKEVTTGYFNGSISNDQYDYYTWVWASRFPQVFGPAGYAEGSFDA